MKLAFSADLSFSTLILRLVLAALMGGFIGLERETKGRPAGFRTYMLVCLGAAAAMLVNLYIADMLSGAWSVPAGGAKTDVSRFGAQVISGVGFLGAGTIMLTRRQEVKGITTAAGLWASACMGLAIGVGFYECAGIALLYIVLSMSFFSKAEERLMGRARNMNIYIEMEKYDHIGPVTEALRSEGVKIFSIDMNNSMSEHTSVSAVISLYLPERQSHTEMLARFSKLPCVKLVSLI